MGGATYRAGLSLVFLVTLIPPRIGICHWGEHARGPWDIRDRPRFWVRWEKGDCPPPRRRNRDSHLRRRTRVGRALPSCLHSLVWTTAALGRPSLINQQMAGERWRGSASSRALGFTARTPLKFCSAFYVLGIYGCEWPCFWKLGIQ